MGMANRTKKTFKSLKAWRSHMGLGQRDAARLLGISQPFYAMVELGKRRPIAPKAANISRVTGVPLANVLGV